jgi:DnaJ-class molecular chaperone
VKKRTPYEELGVDREAKGEDIKRAYRRRAVQCHPDRNGDDPEAHEEFLAVQKAWRILRDPERRARYDETGDDEEHPPVEEKARGMIIHHIAHLAEELPGADVLKLARAEIVNSRKGLMEALKETQQKAKGFRSVAKRLRRKNGKDNAVSASLVQLAENAEAHLRLLAFDDEVITAALKMLDEFEFEVDPDAGPSKAAPPDLQDLQDMLHGAQFVFGGGS